MPATLQRAGPIQEEVKAPNQYEAKKRDDIHIATAISAVRMKVEKGIPKKPLAVYVGNRDPGMKLAEKIASE